MAVFETWLKSDLKKPVTVKQLTGVVFSQDSKANKIGVIVTDNGEPAELAGTVYGYVIKPNGTTVEVAGVIDSEDSSRAYFVMPQEAYAVGHISIVIKLSSTGSVITTLAACTAYVYQSRKGTGVVPTGTVIPDLQALETAISEATSAATAANTAATAANTAATAANTAATNVAGAIAPPFAEATANDAGTYVTKDGKMYFLPDGHTSNATWANTTKTEVTAGGEICDIKRQVDDMPPVKESTETGVDLDISDNSGNVIVRFQDGHIKTKEFDSSEIADELDGKQDALTFDSVPTANSTNPVTSSGIKTALDAKQNTLTFDNEPTENSNNPVKSGGVYLALQNIDVDVNIIKDSDETEADLDVSDSYGNVLARFTGGGLQTKQLDGRKYTTFSKSASYTVGRELTIEIARQFKKDDRIVLHIETGGDPWTSGGRVAYYAGNVQITESTWRGAETYLEYKLTQDVSGISAVLPTNAFYENMSVSFEVSLLGDIPISPKIVTIKKDGSGDYTNLKACLAGIGKKANDVLNPYRIEIYPGTYEVLEDYTEEEKADIFYGETSINQYSQTSFVGPKLLNGMSLIGMGRPEDVILTAWLDPAPTDDLSKRQRGQISTLNLQGSGSIENLTLVAQNMRYCVHDDFSAPLGKVCKRVVKNCIFRGYNIAYGPHTTYGAGMPQGGMDFLFIGCDFGEDVGVHTQPLLYQRPEIHLIDCKGHSFRIGDNETVSPVEEYTVYRLDNCDFMDVRQSVADTVPHAKLKGVGGSYKFYQLDPQTEYNTGEITIVPLSVLGTALTVGTCVEMYCDNASGPRFKAITSLENFAGIVVHVDDDDNTYIQTRGYIRTDRLGLSGFSLNDYIGLDGTDCDVVASASDAFGKIVYIDYYGEGYVKIGGRF